MGWHNEIPPAIAMFLREEKEKKTFIVAGMKGIRFLLLSAFHSLQVL
jgi:hypothetical protein